MNAANKWLTNCWRPNTDRYLRELKSDVHRPLIVGEPKATESFSVEALNEMDMVGIYDTTPESAK